MIPILELMWKQIFILVSMSEHIHRQNRAKVCKDSKWVKQNKLLWRLYVMYECDCTQLALIRLYKFNIVY